MPKFEVQGFGRDSGRRRRREYAAFDEDDAIHQAGDDAIIVERVTRIIDPAEWDRRPKRAWDTFEADGLNEADFKRVAATLATTLNRTPEMFDVTMRLFDELANRAPVRAFRPTSLVYFDQAMYVAHNDLDPFAYLRKAQHAALLELKSRAVCKSVEINAAVGCRACRKQNGKIFLIDDAIRIMPLPCVTCTTKVMSDSFSWCRCDYSPVLEF